MAQEEREKLDWNKIYINMLDQMSHKTAALISADKILGCL